MYIVQIWAQVYDTTVATRSRNARKLHISADIRALYSDDMAKISYVLQDGRRLDAGQSTIDMTQLPTALETQVQDCPLRHALALSDQPCMIRASSVAGRACFLFLRMGGNHRPG